MFPEVALRFVLGGVLVSIFAVLGDGFRPKTFSGVFSAAPAVSLGALSLSFVHRGGHYASLEARSMVLGAIAFVAYAGVCVVATERHGLPVWLATGAAWAMWFAVAFVLVTALG